MYDFTTIAGKYQVNMINFNKSHAEIGSLHKNNRLILLVYTVCLTSLIWSSRREKMARRGENIYKRKDGRWEGRYKSGFNGCGKAKYSSVYGHSYAEVRSKLVPLKARDPVVQVTCRMTVKELFSEWLPAAKLRVKSSTYANYKMKVEKHILPEFGGMRYDTLTQSSWIPQYTGRCGTSKSA